MTVYTESEKRAQARMAQAGDPWAELERLARDWKKKKSSGWKPDLSTKDRRLGVAEIVLGDGDPARGQRVLKEEANQKEIRFLKSPAGQGWLMGQGLTHKEAKQFVKELGKPKQTEKMSLADEIALRVGAVKTKDVK